MVDENGFIYNLLLRTGVVYPEDEPLVVAGEQIFCVANKSDDAMNEATS